MSMTETREKLREAEYFLRATQELFNKRSSDFQFHLNAFVNAARSVTFVMQKEFSKKIGFKNWWDSHTIKTDKTMRKFAELRNISLKERSLRTNRFLIKHDFGPDGLHVRGKKGPTSVVSDPIKFDKPIPPYSYVTVKDDGGERRVKVKIVHDFEIVEKYDNGAKQIKFNSFIEEAAGYLLKLEVVVDECESKFRQTT